MQKYRLKSDPSVTCEVTPDAGLHPTLCVVTDYQEDGLRQFVIPRSFLNAAWEPVPEEADINGVMCCKYLFRGRRILIEGDGSNPRDRAIRDSFDRFLAEGVRERVLNMGIVPESPSVVS